jgi:hypothetical protein
MTDAASTSGSTLTSAVTTANTQANSRRGTGARGNRNNTGNNRNGGNQNAASSQTNTNRHAGRNFKGDTEGMNGHVFQCYEERSDPVQFTRTMEALHAYTKKELKTTDLGTLFGSTPTLPTIAKPKKLLDADKGDEIEEAILKEEVKQYVYRTKELKSNMAAIHSVAWGQCSEAIKAKIKAITGYQDKMDAYDCVWLLTKISSVMQKFEETRHGPTSMVIVLTSLLNCRQGTISILKILEGSFFLFCVQVIVYIPVPACA